MKRLLHLDSQTDTQAIREWARSQGENVAERGRISQDLVIRFQAAHGLQASGTIIPAMPRLVNTKI